ncbi:MAG: DNA-binding response regulator, partial [Epsilonproteobacteria bacterium]
FITNIGHKFTEFDIFNHINYDNIDKEFSSDAIKSLIKRLRKKLPKDSIQNHKSLGYSLNI